MIHSSACEYAIRAMTYVANFEPGTRLLARDISAHERIPGPFLGKIFQTLVRAGLLKSSKGPGGGFSLAKDPALEKFSGRVSDSGEGRWTIKAAIDQGVPTPVLTTALYERFSSRGEAEFQDKLLSAMRYEFGGHVEKPTGR